MKHFGNILEFTKQRNDEIMRAFRHHIAKARHVNLPHIYELVSNSPASRFWVSEECAAIVISKMISGHPLPRIRKNKREMFEEIYRRYILLRNSHPESRLSDLVAMIVNQPAPRFYIAPLSIREIIRNIKYGNRNRRRKADCLYID